MIIENAIIIINKTRLEQLIEKFNTKDQARFYIEHSGSSFDDYENEHNHFKKSLAKIQIVISRYLKYKVIERKYLPNFIFSQKDVAVVVGQDGLVANTAKYTNGLPIIAINPDPSRYDGILLPFDISDFEVGLINTIKMKAPFKYVTMAEAQMNDGQRLLAFNDFFIGPSSHISARYNISYNGMHENHSSSGIIVSTGAGSTGWLSSIFNMANSINTSFYRDNTSMSFNMEWEENRLIFVVREPFQSKYSQTSLTCGIINNENTLSIESLMPSNGLIFSDGIESDFIRFNSGSIVKIGVAEQKATIVQK